MNRQHQQSGGFEPGPLLRLAFYGALVAAFAPRVWHYVEAGNVTGAVILAALAWVIALTGGWMIDPK